MKLLIDMNLSPLWARVLNAAGHEAIHWSVLGSPTAPDGEILAWARQNGYILLTHDLDFAAILAATRADAPSVIQMRTHAPVPERCADLLTAVLKQHAASLAAGALLSVDEERSRIRLLPLNRDE